MARPRARRPRRQAPYAFVPHWFLILTGATAAGALALLLVILGSVVGHVAGQL